MEACPSTNTFGVIVGQNVWSQCIVKNIGTKSTFSSYVTNKSQYEPDIDLREQHDVFRLLPFQKFEILRSGVSKEYKCKTRLIKVG